ncbi:LOW QUALITY PROTEIN: HAUS augmin-like complex subunit 4 [Scleropages formosus]|uniref:LOW QUALITY PROTEIN: HAUS augmin-like complex subunit 4 n=1 Tax=Scleropages formosus TaxID=113540 RepID=UPI0010FAA86C|nr:HAUS augmin-like complex subunit 4 isoform X2 [Scleropages formosus]XP_029108890.1 LOW QUALITY PROTEIN: HAUS augmin-like complex subunit 4 [Scleropages formosus]
MSACPDAPCVPALGSGDSLHQQVLASFPLCQLTEEDLTQNPLFCKFLATLSHHVDRTGLAVSLKEELEKAERELQTQRLAWLQSESLFRLLQEMIQDHCVRQHHNSTSSEDNKFYETMEQCLLVAQCVRQLDPSSTTGQEQPPLLGLSAKHVLDLMPPEKDVRHMKQRLLAELEIRLKKKCFNILSYYQPDWEDESEGLKNLKLSRLPETLESESKRVEALREKEWERATLLQRQTHYYLSELMGCMQILQSLILDYHLKAQKELDKKKVDYLEAKCQIVIRKIRAEMLQLQLDTYTAEKISAHRKIKEKLDAELKAVRAEKQSAESMLSSFEILGQEFEALVQEYSQLRLEIDNKSWALREFSQHSH